MSFRRSFVLIGALLGGGALGCQPSEASGSGPKPCFVDAPCETNTSLTCQVPCKTVPSNPSGSSGGGSAGGAGGTGGAGGASVDVSGSVVRFDTTTFDQVVPHADLTKIRALDVDGQPITVDTAVDGTFAMTGVAEGNQWVLAADASGGSAGIFSTYSVQPMDGMGLLEVPVVPVTVLDDIAILVDVPSFTPGAAHLVLRFVDDASGLPVEGVTLGALAGGQYGFDTGGQGAYTTLPAQTGPLGMGVVLNLIVPSADATITLSSTTFNGDTTKTSLPIDPDTVTYAVIPLTAP